MLARQEQTVFGVRQCFQGFPSFGLMAMPFSYLAKFKGDSEVTEPEPVLADIFRVHFSNDAAGTSRTADHDADSRPIRVRPGARSTVISRFGRLSGF